MNKLGSAEDLIGEGRYFAALTVLKSTANLGQAGEVLYAEVLERTGHHRQSETIVERLLKNRTLTPGHRSMCESVLALMAADRGNEASEALKHMQRALLFAEQSKDLKLICWSQLRLLIALADLSGPNAAAPLLEKARANAMKLGDSSVSAALHIFLGEMEARRGLIQGAVRHSRLGQHLLDRDRNVWLDGRAENTFLAVAIMLCEYDEGLLRAKRALALAEESGVVSLQSAVLGNLGNLHYRLGHFSEAITHFKQAHAALPFTGERAGAYLESLARLSLAEGNALNALECLDQIDTPAIWEREKATHANRYAKLTRSELLAHLHSFEAALDAAEQTIALASQSGDHLLNGLAQLTKAELLHRVGRSFEAMSLLTDIASTLRGQPPDLHARYQRALGVTLCLAGARDAARLHFEHARRIYQGIHDAPGLLDLERVAQDTLGISTPQLSESDNYKARDVSEQIAIWLLHAGRPELVATGLVSLLDATGIAVTARAVLRESDNSVQVLHSFEGDVTAGDSEAMTITLPIGSARGNQVEVIICPRSDVESTVTLNALMLLFSIIRELEEIHAIKEERAALWPLEETLSGHNAVVMGRLGELMTFAQRVARTNISVLITGESGTGKEILARAIHDYSPRADKPFVPFNCTAVPHDMLESQLFGHRRGAFTSADRDNPGLIRSAKDGTLFLDEIGELSLDLQPKLLRFLESGEICPLGEPSPFTVDVRIVAATNSNVEQLVHEGRFREDLYYRLNVIRLTIPPLRERRDEIPALVHHFVDRAATEFSKGRIRVSEDTMEHLILYPWPGNVRQLQNELRRMTALADVNAVLTPAALAPGIRKAAAATPSTPTAHAAGELAVPLNEKLAPTLSRIEGEMIKVALRKHHGRVEAAAKALGISRKGLYLKRQRLGL